MTPFPACAPPPPLPRPPPLPPPPETGPSEVYVPPLGARLIASCKSFCMALPGDAFGRSRFRWLGGPFGSTGKRCDVESDGGGGAVAVFGVGLVFTFGVGAEGKSSGGRSEATGGASMRCSSARGGATLFNVFGVIFTTGPGGGEGRRETSPRPAANKLRPVPCWRFRFPRAWARARGKFSAEKSER